MTTLPDASHATALLRLAATRGGAVARVGAVGQTDRSRSVDPARVTDPRWAQWPRPDPAHIAIGDVTQFKALVYGLPGQQPSARWAADSPAGVQGGAAQATVPPGAASVDASPAALMVHEAPADRIAKTLQHLRVLRGL